MFNLIAPILQHLRQEAPLILNITNDVTSEFIANGLLSLGAAPIMSRAYQEAEELVALAQAVTINPGTLHEEYIYLAGRVCQAAVKLNKPIILDPVGAGASQYRTEFCRRMLATYPLAIIRGNASEIMALAGATGSTKGVDSTETSEAARSSGWELARHYGTTVVISGYTDTIINAENNIDFTRGSPLMPKVTGTGCLLSAVLAAFHAVHTNAFEAAAAGALFYALCGEQAALQASGPGSFKLHFLDALGNSIKEEHYA